MISVTHSCIKGKVQSWAVGRTVGGLWRDGFLSFRFDTGEKQWHERGLGLRGLLGLLHR